MPLTITTFNIQTFGMTRCDNIDRIRAVSRTICELNPRPDILCLIEITASDFDEVNWVCISLRVWIAKTYLELGRTETKYNFIHTFHNGFETYVYFYNPDTVNPLVLESGIKELYTIESGQKDWYPLLDTLKFKKVSKTDTKANQSYWHRLDNYFPLLHFNNRGTCRSLGLGLFEYNNKEIGVLVWHNKAGNGSISYGYMQLLAGSDLCKAGKLTFKDENNNKKTLDNLVLTADFNVDLVQASQYINNPYDSYTDMTIAVKGNSALSYLNEYSFNRFYPDPDKVLIHAFDNSLFYSKDFTIDRAFINPLVSNLKGQRDYVIKFLNNSEFINNDDEEELTDKEDLLNHSFANSLEGILIKYKGPMYNKQKRETIILDFMEWRAKLRKNGYAPLLTSKEILGDRFISFFAEAYSIYVGTTGFRSHSYPRICGDFGSVTDGDAVFLLRKFVSDHLPVTLILK